MKIGIVLGTRPEIIKTAPIIKECEKRGIDHIIIHTGQHYSYRMSLTFLREFGIKANFNLHVGSGTHAETTEKILSKLEGLLKKESPDFVIVLGDTNSALAGALVSIKLHIPLVHVEAGLRSFDRRMPEEYNRVIIDHISDILFPPTKEAKENLEREGIGRRKFLFFDGWKRPTVVVTGNTIVDAILFMLKRINDSKILSELKLKEKEYFLLTLHREENVDFKKRLITFLRGIKLISKKYKLPIVFPIHPRTLNRIKEFGLKSFLAKIENLKLINPVGYLDMLSLEKNAHLVLTDSGGVVEESCTLNTPVVILRDTTDRPEALEVGAAMLTGCNSKRILEATERMLTKERKWRSPYGDGKASLRIINTLERYYYERKR